MKFHNHSAFSLLELLVVMAIIGVLAAVAIPAFSSIGQARGSTEAGFQLAAAMEQARSEAISRNTFVWLGLQQQTNAGNLDLRFSLACSKDGSAALTANNTLPLTRPQLIRAVSLGGSVLGNGEFRSGSVDFKKTLTFTPAGEVLREPSPAPTDGFATNFVMEIRQARGTTILDNNMVTIRLDGSTAIPAILRQ